MSDHAARRGTDRVRSRLLLVEDDSNLAELLMDLLDDAGFQVDHASDSQAGLHLGLARAYQLIVLDRRLPAIEGVDLLRRLRSRGVTAATLMLTARATVADRVEGLTCGADDYLVKPFEVDELIARLRALLRRQGEAADELALGGSLAVAGRPGEGATFTMILPATAAG